jgi:hypothetical protein
MAVVDIGSASWFVPEETVEFLLSEPDFEIPLFGDPFFDITDTEGDHGFIMINSMCGIFEIGNDVMPIDRCAVTAPLTPGRARAYSF